MPYDLTGFSSDKAEDDLAAIEAEIERNERELDGLEALYLRLHALAAPGQYDVMDALAAIETGIEREIGRLEAERDELAELIDNPAARRSMARYYAAGAP